MAKICSLYFQNAVAYDFLTEVISVNPYTWTRVRNQDGTMIETFELNSDAGDLSNSAIMTAIQKLDELDEKCRLYWESERYSSPVWFHMSADTESEKRVLVSQIKIIPKPDEFFTPMLGEGLHFFQCQITHIGIWEAATALTKTPSLGSPLLSNGGQLPLNTISGSLPARIKRFLLMDSNSGLYSFWAGIKPTRDGRTIKSLFELETGSATAMAGSGGRYWNEYGIRWHSPTVKYFDAQPAPGYTDLTNAYDNGLSTEATIPSLAATVDFIYIGLDRPFGCVYMDMGSVVNANAAVLSFEFSTGGAMWGTGALHTNGDETSVGGVTLAQSGFILLKTSSGWVEQTIDGVSAYWIRLKFNATLTSSLSITEILCMMTYPYTDAHAKVSNTGAAAMNYGTSNSIRWLPGKDDYLETIYTSYFITLLAGQGVDSADQLDPYIGRYLVLLRYRLTGITNEAEIRLRMRWGVKHEFTYTSLDNMEDMEDCYINSTDHGDADYHLVELGEISFPSGSLREDSEVLQDNDEGHGPSAHEWNYVYHSIEILAEKISGDNDFTIVLDSFILIPSEHILVGKNLAALPAGEVVWSELEDSSIQAIQRQSQSAPTFLYEYTSFAPILSINFHYPIEGGVLVVAAENYTQHLLDDEVWVEIGYYTRHKNFSDLST